MRIIFSRKGFDSSAGGVASPILPDCTLCSLPIPNEPGDQGGRKYSEIQFGAETLGKFVQDLTSPRRKITGDCTAHLDPDLRRDSVPRREGWKPIFGQSDQAERHLRKEEVKKDDIFLFFGWFRKVLRVAGSYQYAAGAPDLHVIFGWLQIDKCVPSRNRVQIPTWAYDHPHVMRQPSSEPDTLYIATEYLDLPDLRVKLRGGGTFERYHPLLCLTADGPKRSVWRLPAWFNPPAGRKALSYHGKPQRWTPDGDYVRLQTVGRGQEFVLDCDVYPEAIGWLADLFNKTHE